MTNKQKKDRLEGIIKVGTYNFKDAEEGKKARVAFMFETEGESIPVTLFDKAGQAFNRSLLEAVNSGGKIWLEGKISQHNWKGKDYNQFTGFSFGKVVEEDVVLKDTALPGGVLISNDYPDHFSDDEGYPETTHPAIEDIVVEDGYSLNENVAQDTIDVEADVSETVGEKTALSDGFKVKALELHEFNDDLGKFFESFGKLLGPLAIAAGKYVSVQIKDLISGYTSSEELQVVDYNNTSIKGTDYKGQMKVYEITDLKLLHAAGLDVSRDYQVVKGPDGGPTNKIISSIEVKQIEAGQKFYSNAVFYRDDNGFLGKSKEDMRKLLPALLRGERVYGNWTRLVKGQKYPFTGSVEFAVDNQTGRQITKSHLPNEKLELADKFNAHVNGEEVPLVITKEIWAKMILGGHEKVCFGNEVANGISCLNSKGERITLHGQTGIGYLSIDKNLKAVVFAPLTKQELKHSMGVVNDAVVIENPTVVEKVKRQPKMKVG